MFKKIKALKEQLTFAIRFLKLAENPNDTPRVFKLQEFLYKGLTPSQVAEEVGKLRNIPVFKQLLDERYIAPKYKVADLAKYAPGTLGYAYYRHMHDNNFTPDFFPPFDPKNDFSYIDLRFKQTHDLWHVVTGFGVSIEEEVGLQGFYYAQMPDVISLSLLSAGLLHALPKYQTMGVDMLERIVKGWTAGKFAKMIAAVKWEEMWNRSLDDIRKEYNIIPVSDRYDFGVIAHAA
jgi:ubiquinone biosynthesis protein COQ4